MITARVFVNPVNDRLTFDMYLGSDKDNPLYISEITKVEVAYHKEKDCLLLRIHKNDDISIARCDRLMTQNKLPENTVMIPSDWGQNPNMRKKLLVFAIEG